MIQKKNIYNLLDCILPAMFFLTIPMTFFRMFWLWSVIKFVVVVISVIAVAAFWQEKKSNFKFFFSIFFVYNIFSVLTYLYNGYPISCYTTDLFNYVMPMLFVYIGLFDDRSDRSFFDKMIMPLCIVFLLGFVCYITLPSWYVNSLLSAKNDAWYMQWEYGEESFSNIMRYQAFFQDSYPVSHYSIFGLSIAMFNMFRKDFEKKSTLFFVIVFAIAAFLCQHRVAFFSSIVMIFAYVFYGSLSKGSNVIKILLCFLFVIGLLFLLDPSFMDRITDVTDRFFGRIFNENSFTGDLAKRSRNGLFLSNMQYYAFGHGIGSGGSSAVQLGLGGVTDMNYAKMLFESGFCGTFGFALVIFFTIYRAVINVKFYACELGIILFILIAMLASNSLSLYYMYIIPFWYAIGRIWNDEYLWIATQKNMRI